MALQSAEIEKNDINTDLNAVNPTPLTTDKRNEVSRSIALSEKTSRKKKINSKNWKRFVAMISRQRGESYINSKGKLTPKEVPPELLCTARCRLKCNNIKIDHKAIYSNHSMKLKKMPKMHASLVVLRHICLSRWLFLRLIKNISFKYFINCDGVKRKVCKKHLYAIHRIGPAKVSHIWKQVGTGQPTAKTCHQGKHSNQPHKILKEVKDKVK